MDNFIVSARKFRPQTFTSVVGQGHITQTLKNAIIRNQLAHAYLFTGPRGVGKTSCARIFAKAINCLNPTPDHEACGECESCVSFAKDRSFNIHELDAASNNSVDDMRALIEKVRISPQIGKYSVYIIDEVHMLSQAAFNAFLKTLEEPPHYAIFILATTEKHKILPTILSRCQVFDFNRIRVEDMVEYLKYIAGEQGVTYDEESLHIIAQKADGGMRDALSTFDRVVSFCGNNLIAATVAESIGSLDFNTYFKATELALNEKFSELLLLLDEVLKKGFDAQIFIAGMCEHLRNLLIAKNPQTASLLEVTATLSQQYSAQSTAADYEFLFNAINLLAQADTTYKAATNRRLHAELALIKLCGLKKKVIAEHYPMPAIMASENGSRAKETDNKNIAANTAINSNALTTGANYESEPAPRREESPTSLNQQSTPTTALLNAQNESQTAQLNITQSIRSDISTNVSQSVQSQLSQTAQNQAHQTSQSEAQQTSPQPVRQYSSGGTSDEQLSKPTSASPVPRLSVTGLNLNPKQQTDNTATTTSESKAAIPMYSAQEAEDLIKEHYEELIALWHKKSRPRIASAIQVRRINGNEVLIAVPDEVLQDELNQAKLEIERDIMELTKGVRSKLTVIVKHVEQSFRPITLEQKYQFLVDINPEILKLHEKLDLTL